MDSFKGIQCLIKAVQTGSIAAAGRQLGISAAAASQNIARLEQQLGSRLLVRTTRQLALTESGQLYYDRVLTLLQDLEDAGQAVIAATAAPAGRLAVAASAAFARHLLAAALPGFQQLYPRIITELITTDRKVDHIKEAVDVSIRIKETLEDGLVARPLARVPLLFCAAPAYLQRVGKPDRPEQLLEHQCLLFRLPGHGRLLAWRFIRHGVSFEPKLQTAMISDDIDALAAMAVAGAGIARLGAFVAEPLLQAGKLVELFRFEPDTALQAEAEPLEFYLCVQDRHQLTPKVQAFYQYLRQQIPTQWRL